MAIFRWGANFDPLAGLRYMQRELERLHGSLFGESRRVGGGTYPPVNVYESGDEILVQCEVPGVEPGDVEASITGETLAIKGVKRVPPEDEDVKFVRRERGGGEFTRTIVLPEAVEPDKVRATMRDGIMTIRLPKSGAAKPMRIPINPCPEEETHP